MPNYDDLKLSVEALSGGKNTVIMDEDGEYPSIMVAIPKGNIDHVMAGGAAAVHPAFIVNGVEKPAVYISKFENILFNGRSYSLPFKDPAVNINFDASKAACDAKGAGWHLMTNAELAYVALWSKKNGTQPRGNNQYGKDYVNTWEKGVGVHMADATQIGRVATGSGPPSWSHDGTNEGIDGLNGNVWDWVGGMRLNNGEIQIIPDNDAAVNGTDNSDASPLWKAILQDGSLVAPGTANTLKWDYTTVVTGGSTAYSLIAGPLAFQQVDDTPYGNQKYGSIVAASGVTVPEILKVLALFPDGILADYEGRGQFQFRNNGERLPLRGGTWGTTSSAGVFALALDPPRSNVSTAVGFRAAFVS